jgi:hypothetical protein
VSRIVSWGPSTSILIASIIGLCGILGAFFTSDHFGRRPIALAAAVTLSSALLAIGIMSQLPDTTARSTALISFMCLWAFGFNSGVSPVGESYLLVVGAALNSQDLPIRVRLQLHVSEPRQTVCRKSCSPPDRSQLVDFSSQATAQSLSLVFNYSVPLMLAEWNIQAAFFFFGTCTLATVAMFFGLPEVSQIARAYASSN